jgi:hypothetical protein
MRPQYAFDVARWKRLAAATLPNDAPRGWRLGTTSADDGERRIWEILLIFCRAAAVRTTVNERYRRSAVGKQTAVRVVPDLS